MSGARPLPWLQLHAQAEPPLNVGNPSTALPSNRFDKQPSLSVLQVAQWQRVRGVRGTEC